MTGSGVRDRYADRFARSAALVTDYYVCTLCSIFDPELTRVV